jgi:hypothetical protein
MTDSERSMPTEQNGGQRFTCGGRYNQGMDDPSHPSGQGGINLDIWMVSPDGDRYCSYCGSLHEEDQLAILAAYVNGEPGYEFGFIDEPDKRWVNRPTAKDAEKAAWSFYAWHVDANHPELEQRRMIYSRAVERYLQEKNVRTSTGG